MRKDIKNLPVLNVLEDAWLYMCKNQSNLHIFWVTHLAFCAFYNLLPNGFSNPFSLLWLILYYVFWCIFFRFYYGKRPYFSFKKILASAVPSSKMLFISFALMFFLLMVPYIPLLMGFNNKYLLVFENYMATIASPEISLFNVVVFSFIFLLISPIALCRPYLAWISALQGYSGSVRKVFKKTKQNNLRFLYLMFLLNLPGFFVYGIDLFIGCHGWLCACFYSIYLIYFNLVFAKIYDYFYAK